MEKLGGRQLREFDINETSNQESRFKRGYPKALTLECPQEIQFANRKLVLG